MSQRSQRRRFGVLDGCFPRRSAAMDCYYTHVTATGPSITEQLERIRRGAAEIIVEDELRAKVARSLQTRVPLKVKLGLDPTAPDLHLGHTVVLQKLRDFQELGHQVIIVIGDFTGMIGDPTGRSETRKPLTWDEIRDNAETYKAQLAKVLDMPKTLVRFNSEWLGPLTFEQIIRETSHLTVARMLQREDFSTRYEGGRAIRLHEFLYPLAQAYDSVALGADVELGGTDQTFNLLVGRDLQRAHGQDAQVALTVPILEGLDGVQKMSKSLGNYVGITERPADMYGKLMSLSDELMFRYFELVTRVSEAEIQALRRLHPMEAKKRLAWTITAMYHGEHGAREGEAHFSRVHQSREEPENVEERTLEHSGGGAVAGKVNGVPGRRLLWSVLKDTGLAKSTSEARRLIQQGAVAVDRAKVTSTDHELGPGRYLVQVGRRQFMRVIIPGPQT